MISIWTVAVELWFYSTMLRWHRAGAGYNEEGNWDFDGWISWYGFRNCSGVHFVAYLIENVGRVAAIVAAGGAELN